MDGEASGLSAGRSRRSTAGNRMRELLEQERERLEAKRGNEDDEMFQEEEGDVDFEAKVEDIEDIIDSDFDQSSDEAEDGEDELEGEKEIEEEERAAKKASRVKAAPIGVRRSLPVSKSARVEGSEAQASSSMTPKKISFAANSFANQGGKQRSSKRKSTIDATMSVQARMKMEEKRRQEVMDRATPRRKKVKLSQADRIGEALEMEEQNRASLKKFLELEEERRERDRKRGKKGIEGPFIRFHSVAEDRNAHLRTRMIEEVINSREKKRTKVMTVIPTNALTEDPVFAARDAAGKEREVIEASNTNMADKRNAVHSLPDTEDNSEVLRNLHSRSTTGTSTELAEREKGKAELCPASDFQTDRQSDSEKAADEFLPESAIDVAEVNGVSQENFGQECERQQGEEKPQKSSSPDLTKKIESQADTVNNPAGLQKDIDEQIDAINVEVDLECGSIVQIDVPTLLSTQEKNEVATQIEKDHPEELESKTYISLHQLEPESPWHINWSYILGSHVDWSNYPLVPARNRPLRPRQSICPITGLSAIYRDPRTGIAYANKEAYYMLTKVMSGQYLWSGKPMSSSKDGSDQEQIIYSNYEPLEMGCWLDHVEEGGACNVINTAANRIKSVLAPTGFRPKGAIAPGDEKALVAAAQALPAGTTRSGGRRSANTSL